MAAAWLVSSLQDHKHTGVDGSIGLKVGFELLSVWAKCRDEEVRELNILKE